MKKVVPTDAVLIPDQATKVFEGIVFDVYHWQQKLFDGSPATFEMLRRADTAVTIPVIDNKLLIIHDEQPYRGSKTSFPGGRVDPADSSVQRAAQRELHEETGYKFAKWRLLDVFQPHTKIEWFVYVFIAWDKSGHDKPHIDAGERITAKVESFDKVKKMALANESYLKDAAELFKKSDTLEELLASPDFEGRLVDRK